MERIYEDEIHENDQLSAVEDIAGPVPEIPAEYDQILNEEDSGMMSTGEYLPEDLVLAARRVDLDWVHSEGVYETVPMQECRDAGMKPLDLIWVDTDKSVDPTRRKFDRGCVQENTKRRSSTSFSIVLCNATS